MTLARRLALVLVCLAAFSACQLKEDSGGSKDGGPPPIPAPPDVAAPPEGALKTASGIASKVLRVGLGTIRPGPRSTVRVHYTGWTTDGKMFDSSYSYGKPVEFSLDMVIPGWTEGLQLMVVGEQRRFWIPGALAYDNIPDRPGMPPSPKGVLVFDIELLDVR
jgi:FKBP-type peptidyl-prolyl cis-trans isomerase